MNFLYQRHYNVGRVAWITMDSWKMGSSSEKSIKKDKDNLFKTIGIENVKATIFLTDLTFLNPKLTNYQSNLWYFCDKLYEIFVIEAHNESHGIGACYTTAFKICDACWCNISKWLMVYHSSNKCTQICYWCHLATNTLQPWTESWDKKGSFLQI